LREDGWVDLTDAGQDACSIHGQSLLLGWDAVRDLRGLDEWSVEDRYRLLLKLERLRDVHQEAVVKGLKHDR